MNCPKCGKALPENAGVRINFCPVCGGKLFVAGRKYLIEIQGQGARDGENGMMVFLDEHVLYEVRPGESICFPVEAGFHTLKFRQKIRSKAINLLVTSNYLIKTHYNSLSGLIETNVQIVENTEGGIGQEELNKKNITSPIMVSEDGQRSFDIMLGDDEPEYEIKVTSGLQEGILRLYTERCEFSPSNSYSKDVTLYKNVMSVKKKMGSIDIQCEGNVHKVYSIPKDIYNEVMAFLTNRISEVQSR